MYRSQIIFAQPINAGDRIEKYEQIKGLQILDTKRLYSTLK